MNLPMTARAKVELFLKSQTQAVSTSEIARLAGTSKTAVTVAISDMRSVYRGRLVTNMVGRESFHRLLKDVPKPSGRLHIQDLWRGWVNPKTKIVPPSLGLYGYRRDAK